MLLFIESISFCLARKSELPLPSSRRKPCISSATCCGISSTRSVAYHQHEVLYPALGFRLRRIYAPTAPDKQACRSSWGVCGPKCLLCKHLFRRGYPCQNTKDTMRCPLCFGRGSWIRTNECRSQSPVPYRLAIPL